ncbi:hypothetical protein ACTWLI_06805 [Arthrobacter sp. Hor0625]|uniref:hypothetical protein n=1 Tax=Arthrobacter sp. Hor0625 TaxID=3457358 RepID=UPI00403E6FC2
MQLDLSTVETGTLVFFGTLLFAFLIALFIAVAAFAALVLVGLGRLSWLVTAGVLLGLVRCINTGWDLLLHHAAAVELPGDFPGELIGQSSPSTGTYPRVALRDS